MVAKIKYQTNYFVKQQIGNDDRKLSTKYSISFKRNTIQ